MYVCIDVCIDVCRYVYAHTHACLHVYVYLRVCTGANITPALCGCICMCILCLAAYFALHAAVCKWNRLPLLSFMFIGSIIVFAQAVVRISRVYDMM